MVGSLLLLSSSSKKTRSGLTHLSLWSQAGNTYFFSKLSWVLFMDLARMTERMKELTRPTEAEATKNLPLMVNLLWTKFLKEATLLKAWRMREIVPNKTGWCWHTKWHCSRFDFWIEVYGLLSCIRWRGSFDGCRPWLCLLFRLSFRIQSLLNY